MRILVVDNNTVHKNALASSLKDHQVEVQLYKPGINFRTADKDLIILSGGGGAGREIKDYYRGETLWYQDQIDFVRTVDKPILGICMGFEVISHAFGSPVVEMSSAIEGVKPITTTKNGNKILKTNKIHQHKSHKWYVGETPEGFEEIAKSKSGIEMIIHKEKPILASQFHPEVRQGTLGLQDLSNILVNYKKK